MSGELEEVFKLLPKLAIADLSKVATRVSFLRGVSSDCGERDWLLEGFFVELRRRGLWVGTSINFSKVSLDGYKIKADFIRKYLLSGYGKVLPSSPELILLGTFAGRSLAEYLLKAKVPLSVKTLVSNVDKVPQAIDACFPGYWAAGLIGFCITKKK